MQISPIAFIAIQAALQAGNMLRRGFGTAFNVTAKGDALDLVTDYDKAAESAIINLIRKEFPDHSILAEESGLNQKTKESEVLWIIDPLDGTMNFAHHIPLFAVSIAVVIKGITEIGVVYDPIAAELFAAQRGHGSYFNGTRMHVSEVKEMRQGVTATLFPYGIGEKRQQTFDHFDRLSKIGNPIRIIGSAALALAYVAAGRFDLFWGNNLKPWDIAASELLIKESGGRITNYAGEKHDIYHCSDVVATNHHLHGSMLEILK